MQPSHQVALNDLPDLTAYLDEPIAVANKYMNTHITYSPRDHLSFMLCIFLSKQYDHAKSLRVLVEAGRDRDSILIARTSLEGLALILWTLKNPEARAKRWRSYVWVAEYKEMLRLKASDEKFDPEREKAIESGLKEYGADFIMEKHKKKQTKNLPVDPYTWEWSGISERELFSEVGASPMYKTIYASAANWSHWSLFEMGGSLSEYDGVQYFNEGFPAWAASSMATVFQSLFQMIEQFGIHFAEQYPKELGEELADLRERFAARIDDVAARIEAARSME